MSDKLYWVAPDRTLWKVIHQNITVARYTSKEAAVAAGRTIAENNRPSRLQVVDLDAQVEAEWAFHP